MPEGLRLREGERACGERDASGAEKCTGAGAAGTDMVVMNEAIFVQRNFPWMLFGGALIGGVWLHSDVEELAACMTGLVDRGMGVGMPYHAFREWIRVRVGGNQVATGEIDDARTVQGDRCEMRDARCDVIGFSSTGNT